MTVAIIARHDENPQDVFQPKSGEGLLPWALDYAARGWAIIPTIDKGAVAKWKKFQERPPDEASLRRLFARPGVNGLAAIAGSVSGGLAVRDFDRQEAYLAWASAHPDDASRLPTVRTFRGSHVFGRLDADAYHGEFGDGELIGDSKHYVSLPPSLHRAIVKSCVPTSSESGGVLQHTIYKNSSLK
jgi:hypothetical protein